MAQVIANGIQIEYEIFGEKTNPAIVLIAGNGAQLNFWEPDFCELLVKSNLQVIRFDNRDVGLSTKFDAAGIPDMQRIYQEAQEGKPIKTAYTLEDMADDIAGLLDALHIKKAHICGASMGGAIAQVFAYRHPSRIYSLVSIMSSTGNPNNPQISKETLAIVTAPPPNGRDAYIDYTLGMWKNLWSKGFPFEEERGRRYCEESYDRSFYPQGAVRQNAALVANGDRRKHLSLLTVPTLVIHGTADLLFNVEAGKDTARTIPNAKLLLIEGMGHDMPKGTWETIVEAIASQVKDTSIFPGPILNLPKADIPLKGLSAYLSQGENHQIIFMEFSEDVDLPMHCHESQVGFVLEGKIDLIIDGIKNTYEKGDRYFIPSGVKHSGKIYAGYADITFFNEKDRYNTK